MTATATHTCRPASTAIKLIQWFREGSVLAVTFTSGKTYRYRDVPETTYREFVNADSAGKHFAAAIRDRFPLDAGETE